MAPDHDSRWSDSEIQTMIHIADLAVREEAEVEYASYEIDLVNGAYYYTLPNDVTDVRSVEFSRDGLVYDGGFLECVTLEEMDDISLTWQTDTGSFPSVFSLMSVPGTKSYSRILIWRPIPTTSGQKVRVNYVKCRPTEASLSGLTMPDEIQEKVYVPYVLSLMEQTKEGAGMAAEYMAEYKRNLGRVKARYGHRNVMTRDL